MIRKYNTGLVALFVVFGFLACKPQTKSSTPDDSGAGDVVGEDPFGGDDTGIVPTPGEIIPVDEPLYDPPLPPSADDSPEISDTEDEVDESKETGSVTSNPSTKVVSVDLNNLAGNKVYAINASGQADWLSSYKAGEYIMVWGALGESFNLTKSTSQGSSRSLGQTIKDRIFGSKTSEVKSDPTRQDSVGSDSETSSSSSRSDDDGIVSDLRVEESGLNRDEIAGPDDDGVAEVSIPSAAEKQTLVQRAKEKFSDLKKRVTDRYSDMTPEQKKRYQQLGIVAAISVSLTLIVALPAALAGKGSAVEEAFSQGETSTAQCLDSQQCVVIAGKVHKLDQAASLEELACLYEPKNDKNGKPVVIDGKQQYSCNVENGKIIGSMNQSSGSFSAGDGGDILVYDHSECVKSFGSKQSCQKKPIRLSEMKSVGTQTIVGVVIDPTTGELTKKWVSVQGEVLEPSL
ncbi:MAG: hypothetical protein AB8C84_12870 [Oligoflexales bacterium]